MKYYTSECSALMEEGTEQLKDGEKLVTELVEAALSFSTESVTR